MIITKLEPTTILALAKMLSDKVIDDARDQVDAGEYEVEAVVHIDGDLTVEEAVMTTQVNRIDPYLLLQVALSKLPKVQIDALVKEALKRIKKGEKPDTSDLKESVACAMAKLTKATKQPRRGAISFAGDISGTES